MNAYIGPWLSENAEGKNVIETVMLPEFYEELKRKKAQHKMDAEAIQAVLKRSNQSQ